MGRALALLASALLACAPPMALHAPTCAPRPPRAEGTRVDLQPIGARPAGPVELGPGDWTGSDVAAVLTSGMSSELAARALRGGEDGGYVVECALDRFALRRDASMAEAYVFATLYVDLACGARRRSDSATVWRGELRARDAAIEVSVLEGEAPIVQRLADRLVSDAARELASDLAVRALLLEGEPSQRVFADETARHERSGVDDLATGTVALSEDATRLAPLLARANDPEPGLRAGIWNAIAMCVGPGEPWPAGDRVHLDDEELVRFFQYKALARLGSDGALAQLRQASERESSPLLVELLEDALATHGIGLTRSRRPDHANAAAVTNGTTGKP